MCVSVDVKNVPAMAVVAQSAGPTRRPGGGLYPVRIQFAFLIGTPHFLFENRAVVTFPIEKEINSLWRMVNNSYLNIDHWSIFKKR